MFVEGSHPLVPSVKSFPFVLLLAAHTALGVPERDPCAFPEAAPRDEDEGQPFPGFGSLVVASPPAGAAVPRNVEIRLAGDVANLDSEPPLYTFELRAQDGSRVAFAREGGVVRPVEPLPADSSWSAVVAPTSAHPCPDCITQWELVFMTTSEIDTEPPLLEELPPINVFVMPSPEEASRCGMFFGTTHQIFIEFGPRQPSSTWVTVSARKDGSAPRRLVESFLSGSTFTNVADVGPQVPVALGDPFTIGVTLRDLAGNVGPARVVRVLARSFADQQQPMSSLDPLWCAVPPAVSVAAQQPLPPNGRIVVDFPFEEVPLALAPVDGGAPVPLIPMEDTAFGHVYGAALPLPAGAQFDVIGLDCPHCTCPGCTAVEPVRIAVGESPDVEPPAAPVVTGFREDVAPERAFEEECRPDRPALLVELEPGRDDVTDALALRYDASVRAGDAPARVLARSAIPYVRADGSTVLRLETAALGRLLAEPFELTLDAVDAAGHRTSTTARWEPSSTEASGCASGGTPGWMAWAVWAARGPMRRRRIA